MSTALAQQILDVMTDGHPMGRVMTSDEIISVLAWREWVPITLLRTELGRMVAEGRLLALADDRYDLAGGAR